MLLNTARTFRPTPWPISVALVARLAGRLADRLPVAILGTAGLSVMAAGAAMGAAAEREPRYPSSPPRRLSLVPAPARRVTGAGEWRCD